MPPHPRLVWRAAHFPTGSRCDICEVQIDACAFTTLSKAHLKDQPDVVDYPLISHMRLDGAELHGSGMSDLGGIAQARALQLC